MPRAASPVAWILNVSAATLAQAYENESLGGVAAPQLAPFR